jgi:hypothetical protein
MTSNVLIWYPFDNGNNGGKLGSENGIIIRDEEHPDGARITLERDGKIAPFSITCGIYGWMVHTRYFSTEDDAQQEFIKMQVSLDEILSLIPLLEEPALDAKMEVAKQAISEFVEQYP